MEEYQSGKTNDSLCPSRTFLPEEETGKYSCYHTSSETQRRERMGGEGGVVRNGGGGLRKREIKTKKV